MINFFYDCYNVLNKVYRDKTFIKQALSETPIEPKNKPTVTKTCYGVLDKDIELSYYITCFADKSPKLAIKTILKIGMYAIKYLDKKVYAVTKNIVELTKKLGKGGASGFVNAFMHKFATTTVSLPKDKIEFLSVKHSYPLFALKEIIKDYGFERAEKIISTQFDKTCLVFYETDGKKYLTDRGYAFTSTPFDNVFLLDRFNRDEGFYEGKYTYQVLGSVAICDCIPPCENILDCCAAPGGKSVRLSYKCKNVTATDIYPHRVELIKSYANRMKRSNVTASVADSKELNADFIGAFDTVLCDAPCSGLGVVNDNPDIKLNRNVDDIEKLNYEQSAILENVCNYVKVGGYLFYSTCSLLKKENIDIVNRFLSSHNNFVIEGIDSPLPHENDNGTLSFLPDISGGLGFYVAKLKKIR